MENLHFVGGTLIGRKNHRFAVGHGNKTNPGDERGDGQRLSLIHIYKEALSKLNAIVHPLVIEKIRQMLTEIEGSHRVSCLLYTSRCV